MADKLFPASALAAALLAGCGNDDSPAGASITIPAPVIVDPQQGAELNDERPTLVVSNVTVSDGSTPSYAFQVARDAGFANVAAEISGVAQDPSGQTSWRVNVALGNGDHFWRARARVGGTDGPYSAAADFNVLTPFKSDEPRDGVLVFDPLTNGTTVGTRRGGVFTDEGWLVNSPSNQIIYNMDTIESGFLEVDIKGLDIRNLGGDKRNLFVMWDPVSSNDLTTNPYRASVQKQDRSTTNTLRYLRVRWISNGRQIDAFSGFLGWHPERAHHFRWQWGPEGPERRLYVRLFIDGDQRIFFEYREPYRPKLHRIELGAGGRFETPEGASYSNLVIGVRE
ncbi:MAG: hypothetical protein ACRD1X_05525 [Vicinamibacteria bacterium]